jgi:hypothetical protein
MDVTNNSTIETVIEFANVKFGMEISREQLVEQLKNLSFSETLKLINSMKADDNDAFSEIIDLSSVSETVYDGEDRLASLKITDLAKEKTKQHTLPQVDTEKYQERDGLEGPIQTKVGKVVYYDPKEGKYYDPDTDIYLSYEEWKELSEEYDKRRTTEQLTRLRELAGIKEEIGDVYTTLTDEGEMSHSTMHGLLDQIEDYYHNKYDSDEMDIQIGDDTVWIGDEQFSIEKNGEELGSDLGNELEREDISKGNGPYQHKLQGDDLERSKTMTPDEIKVLAGVTNEWVQDSPAQGFSGQERNFIEELCLRMDGVSKSPEGLRWMGKSETWDEGNVLSNKGKLTTVMLWAKKNIDDLYHKMGSEFKVYSDGNDEGDSGRGQSDGNQIIQNIINKVGKIGEDINLEEYGTMSTAYPSRATIRAGNTKLDRQNRRANNMNQDATRDSKVPNRTVAGSNIQPTGTGASRAGSEDPDDQERAENSYQSQSNAEQANVNAQEIERLKQLAMGG